jgi:drug/metabolite transporter (DMT)-like permease
MKRFFSSRAGGYCMAIAGGVLWAVGGSCGQALFRSNTITADWLIPVRLLIAGPLVLLLAKASGADLLGVWRQKKHLPWLCFYAVCGVAASQYTFYGCIQRANVAFATVLCYAAPVLILLWSMIREKRRPRLYEVAAVLCVVVGVFACATHFDLSCLSVSQAALILGLLCALTSAFNTLLPLGLMEEHGMLPTLGWGMLLGGIAATLIFRPWRIHPTVNPSLVGFMAVIILGGTVAAFILYMRGIRLVGAVAGNVLSAAEPVAAVIISALVLHVVFTPADFLGFVLILATIPLIALGQAPKKQAAEAPQ